MMFACDPKNGISFDFLVGKRVCVIENFIDFVMVFDQNQIWLWALKL